MPPAEFIPLAEETDLIVPLGRWVLEQACRQGVAWQQGPAGPDFTVAVNVSARQLANDAFVDDVRRILDETAMPALSLILEITETALATDVDAIAARLSLLKDLGVRIAVDDFGTGYASLSYLSQFPVDIIKIDKSFVDHIATGSDRAAFADGILGLGKRLHLETVAEGVEDEAQATRLRSLGCDFAQGYHFARPLTADALGRRLEERLVGTGAMGGTHDVLLG